MTRSFELLHRHFRSLREQENVPALVTHVDERIETSGVEMKGRTKKGKKTRDRSLSSKALRSICSEDEGSDENVLSKRDAEREEVESREGRRIRYTLARANTEHAVLQYAFPRS